MPFTTLGLLGPIARAVANRGYTSPSPIQAQAIPVILEGRDILGSAQTGTGKTGAFALPILHQLAEARNVEGRSRPKRGHPRALILCPTRELAEQVHDNFVHYGANLNLTYTTIYGGVSQRNQVRSLNAGVDVVVATPGRLLDLINQGHVRLGHVQSLVLDEADQMLDMGFVNDIKKIVAMTPESRQTLFFSATMPPAIQSLTREILTDPVRVQTANTKQTAEDVDQIVYKVNQGDKADALQYILSKCPTERAIVFVRTKHGADRLATRLESAGLAATSIHGNKTQRARLRALEAFRRGHAPILVATDVAARGIDVKEVERVINVELPPNPETYVHRIGRTARAGASGLAISLCDRSELRHLRNIERLLGDKLPLMTLDRSDAAQYELTPPPAKPERPAVEVREQREARPERRPERSNNRNNDRFSDRRSDRYSDARPGSRGKPARNKPVRDRSVPPRSRTPEHADTGPATEGRPNTRPGNGVHKARRDSLETFGAHPTSKPSHQGGTKAGKKPHRKGRPKAKAIAAAARKAEHPMAGPIDRPARPDAATASAPKKKKKPSTRKPRPGKRQRQANREQAQAGA